ncbi:MAG: hypothetical protein J6A59_18030 [Lachnospiraceae bacterium]|nr:hypothetical protein [Lachnospiraceae bacterium]
MVVEALREHGWNRYDVKIICPDDVRKKVVEELATMKTGIFPMDKDYFGRCRKKFSYPMKKNRFL